MHLFFFSISVNAGSVCCRRGHVDTRTRAQFVFKKKNFIEIINRDHLFQDFTCKNH